VKAIAVAILLSCTLAEVVPGVLGCLVDM
jgi:hypothetical protein